MPFVQTNDHRIHYTHNGVTSGQTALVLVHGAGGNHGDWPPVWQQPAVAGRSDEPGPGGSSRWLARIPVYALDLPGHGRSDPPGRSDVDRYAQDVLDFSQALGLKRVVLAGYSMGGAIDLAIALRQPAFLDGLILVGSGARLPVTSLILDGLRTDFSGTVQLIAKFACGTASPPHLKQQVVQRMLDNPPEVVLGDYLACNTFDVRERLAEIRLPTLIIGASHDKMMPPKFSFFLHERIPQSQLVIVEDAGHTMALEKTAEVTAEIVKFLDGSKSGSR